MAIPLSVITKAQKGKNADHAISDKNLIALQYGMENAIAVIDNPARNSLAFITSLEEDGGQVAVFFDKNVQFDGDQVNKATSIHRRTNIVGLMNNLSENAIIYVKNKNEFDALVGMADSIPAAYKGKIKFVDESISQDGDSVKRSDSDIAQIESVISEARRDKEEMYSDFDGQEAPKNVQQEIKCSTRFNEEYMDAAIARNEKLGNVDAGLLNQAAKDRAAVAKLMRQLQADKKIGLPEDILGNTFFADSSYGGSEENTTICPRSLASEAFMDAVSDYIGRPLTVAEQIYISQDLQGRTATPECLYCYVATDRKAYREFLGRYIQQRDDVLGKIKAGQSDMEKLYQEFLDGPSWMVTNTPYCAGG